MKAIILVGGQGTRLHPLTLKIPKAMVPVLNRPFLEYVFHHLSRHQITDIALTLGHLAQPIVPHFGRGEQFGVRLSHVIEDTPLGTAGAVKNAEEYLGGTFAVLNGDIFTDLDITAMLDFHRERGAIATIALTPVDDPTAYGLIETDAQGRVHRFLEKPSWDKVTTNMINAGTYILEPQVLDYVLAKTNTSFERELFPQLLDRGEPVYGFASNAYWIDMGTLSKYFQLHRDLIAGKSSIYTPARTNQIQIGRQCHIHPTAQISGPAIIGDGCQIGNQARLIGPVFIGNGCQVQPRADIVQCIIWNDVIIGPGSTARRAIIASKCQIQADCFIGQDSVLGDSVTVTSGCIVAPGSKIEPGTVVSKDC